MTNHCPLGLREQSLLDGSAGQGEADRARERCNGHVSQSCPPVSFFRFEQILRSLFAGGHSIPLFLTTRVLRACLKVFPCCPCPALTRDLIRVDATRTHTRKRWHTRELLPPVPQGKTPPKAPVHNTTTTREREIPSLMHLTLESDRSATHAMVRLTRDTDPLEMEKQKKLVNLHNARAPVSTPCNIYICIYICHFSSFFGSAPCLPRYGFFFPFYFLRHCIFLQKALRLGHKHVVCACNGPRKNAHGNSLAPNPVSLTLQRKRDNGLGFIFFSFFFLFFLLNSSAGCTCCPRSSLNREGRGSGKLPKSH